MTDIDPEQARARLEAERERLERQLRDIREERREDGPIDSLSGDAGADTTTAATDLGLEANLRQELAEIDAAFDRLDDGTYGIDEDTGEPIDPARLEAVPAARTNAR